MVYMRSSLAGDRKVDYSFKSIESITIEVRTDSSNICFCRGL